MKKANFLTFSAINAHTAANQIQAKHTYQALLSNNNFLWTGFFLGDEKDTTEEYKYISFTKFQRLIGRIGQNVLGLNFTWYIIYPLFFIINMSKVDKDELDMKICLCRALPLAFYLVIFRKKLGVKYLIYECHRLDHLNNDFKVNKLTRKLFAWMVKSILQKSDGIICLTTPLKKMIEDGYKTKGNNCVISDGHSFSYDTNNVGLFQNKTFSIIYSGMTFKEHGVEQLVESLYMLPDDLKLLLVGGADDEVRKISDKYSDLIEKGKLELIGRVAHAEIEGLLRLADCAILSLADNINSRIFCSCLKMFEYMAVGLPIIAPDYPAIRDVLNEDNAVLIEDVSPVTYSEAILYLKANEDACQRISNRAYEASKKYTYRERAYQIDRFVQKITKVDESKS